MAVFFMCLATAFYMGYRLKPKPPAPTPLDDKEKQRAERFEKHFKDLFSYDVDTALQRKKVELGE